MKNYGPAWAEINLDALAFNMRNVKEFVTSKKKDTKVLAVVKADGYGHGAIETARTFIQNGVDYLGVATILEALELRKAGVTDIPILNFSYTPDTYYSEAIKNNITMTVYNLEMAETIADMGHSLGIEPKIHLKLDTGMTRLGMLPSNETIEIIAKICDLAIDVEGIYTHFAMADSKDKTPTHEQAKRYIEVIDKLEERGITFAIRHICNSAAMIELPEYYFDMVRAGGILYGHFCLLHYIPESPIEIKQALSIRALLSNFNEVPAGTGVSYGWFYKTENTQTIGAIPIGYTDGISRKNTNNAEFLLHGKRVKQVGLICMDQMMIDISQIDNPNIGDVVTLLGKDGDEIITLEERAKAASIGKCELFAGIGRRLPKVYFKDSKHIKTISYL